MNNLTNCEKSFCHRLVSLASANVGRALREAGIPLDEEKRAEAVKMISAGVLDFIGRLRELDDGVAVEDQDRWIGGLTLGVLGDVWGVRFDQPVLN